MVLELMKIKLAMMPLATKILKTTWIKFARNLRSLNREIIFKIWTKEYQL